MSSMDKNNEVHSEGETSGSDGDSSSDSDSSNSDSSSSSNSNSGSNSSSDSSKKSSNGNQRSSHSEAASSDEENCNNAKDSSHCSSSSNNDRGKSKIWEKNPDMYGVRRSSREKKQPERISVANQAKENKATRKRSDQWHSSDESHSDSSHSEGYSYQQKVRKKVPLKKKNTSYTSDDYEENNRMRASRAGGKVSYKEESETGSASDHEETQKLVPYETTEEDPSTQTIDKVIRHRTGKIGAVGQQTYIYEVEKMGDPNANFDPSDPTQVETQYLIKWKGWAHIHNTWESFESLHTQKVKGMKKLENYVQKEEQFRIWKSRCTVEEVEYTSIQNEMEQEFLASHVYAERIFAEAVDNDVKYYYVKWKNIPYSEATWENETIVSERFSSQLAAFQSREQSHCYPKPCSVLKYRPKFRALKEQPNYIGMNDTYILRDYQLDGLNWLVHAWSKNNSVILADEMGLGKTIQAISFMSYLFHYHDLYGPFLVVLPLSTINAWLKEFEQWAPNMNVIVYMGDRSSRNIIHEYEWVSQGSRRIKFNAVLTTYEILLRDKDLLQDSCQWACLLVDEAHRLKNEESQLYQALIGFKTNYRLLITGTPLQNSLKELWALLHFIMPDKFYDCDLFESISDKDHMKKGIHRLHKQLEPYILRRVKKEVEKSLPAKVEQILRVDMTQVQRNYYRYILTKNYEKLRKGNNGSVSSFNNIVMELKKCCNHATLIRMEDEPIQQKDILQKLLKGSGKLLLLDKLLVRLHETGHRVLIFSQMVMMLDILAYYMQLRRFPFQRLDGSISGELRRQALEHFNADGSPDFCFLLSTRAGGLGINLATADTVVIFDSDWNPQNDLQAQARAHRIGQKNQVNIYRLVTKSSIEETIIERAKQKMVLDHLVIQSMDTSGRTIFNKKLSNTTATPFNKEELNAILKFGAEDLFRKEDDDNEEEPVCDIDEILQRAETRDEGPSSAGDDLLSAFKVASFNLEEEPPKIDPVTGEEKDWDDIIPENVRSLAIEEEKQKEMAKLYLPPRKRNTANSSEKGSARERARRRRSSDFSDCDSEQGRPRRRGRPRMHHKDTVKGFTDIEVRRFVKSFKKFANPLRRLDTIATDASLREKSTDDMECLGRMIVERCKETIIDHTVQKASSDKYPPTPNGGTKQRRDRGPSFKISGVAINAKTMIATLDELEPLDYVVPHAPVERALWVLQLKKVKDAHWDIPWGINEDSRLLRGIYEFGMGTWDQIKSDADLNLGDKILLPEEQKPQAKHLENRAQYLLKLLKKLAPVNISKPKPKSIRPKRTSVKETKIISKEIIEDDSTDDEATNHSTFSATKSSPKTSASLSQRIREDESIKMEVDSSKVRVKNEPAEHSEHKSEHHRSKPKKSEKKSKEKHIPAITNGTPSPITGAMDLTPNHPLWLELKDMMRPMKKVLKMLGKSANGTSEDDLKVTRKCLLEIGDYTEKVIQQNSSRDDHSQWKLLLWQFVSKFTERDPKLLHKLYKTHKKEKESRKEASHRDKDERSKSEHKEHKREKRKLEDPLQSHSKRPRNGCPNEKEKDSHLEVKHKKRKRDHEWSNDVDRNHDRHASSSRDYPKESRYPQDLKREGHSGGGYHRESNYPYHGGSDSGGGGGYAHQGYYNRQAGKGDFGGQRSHQSHHQSYSSSQSNYLPTAHYPPRGGGYSQPPPPQSGQSGGSRSSHSQRSNYNHNHSSQYGSGLQKPVGWSHGNRDDRGPPPFQS